ncbi:MAG: LptF/LptG family permease [Prevotella sp.]|nr:LptF/LptG family permease [Bacteroides sp.]MCM1366301.1 LptF/LptG family permease [Prevotella sp.]MCM1437105.1 LptF/LptG family permease [Prevotella sp.]
MRIIKRLHLFILQSFLPLFAMTFFIVLFIVLMQFLWKYIDDLVGKGLSVDVIGELFFYAAVSMVPMALPLAILLASLMTFGNLGEKFELTAMKASGISLVRVMTPLIILVGGISVGAFFFQNNVLPKAQVKMWTLLFSMRQKSPEVEIPQGVFYDRIPGYSLFVKTKNQETGLLYNVMIYDIKEGGDNSTILLSDSALLAFTPDNRYLYLHLFHGEQFENLREARMMDANVPFRRENFEDKQILIPFDANFNRLDEEGMRKQYVGKNIAELNFAIDSIGKRVDSIGDIYAVGLKNDFSSRFGGSNSRGKKIETKGLPAIKSIDSLLILEDAGRKGMIYQTAVMQARGQAQNYEFKSAAFEDEKRVMRRNKIELIKKFTLSVACIIMFFIGAPLGAIIRKGGIGTPLVISVLLFLVYYIIDNTGYKMARDGRWDVNFGIWLSTIVLAPLGIYVTYKAMNDSAVFDKDAWLRVFRRFLPERDRRKIEFKEVVFKDISEKVAVYRLNTLVEECKEYEDIAGKDLGYFSYFKRGYDRKRLLSISDLLEGTIDYLRDSTNRNVVGLLSSYPYVSPGWYFDPGRYGYFGKTLEIFFPTGVVIWLYAMRKHRKMLYKIGKIKEVSERISSLLENQH